jgi:hypothetical protein
MLALKCVLEAGTCKPDLFAFRFWICRGMASRMGALWLSQKRWLTIAASAPWISLPIV